MRSRRLAPRFTSVQRRSSGALLGLLMLSAPHLANAQPAAEPATDAAPTEAGQPAPGSSMDQEGADPVASEVADKDAPFVPRGKDDEEAKGAGASWPQTRVNLQKPLTLVGDVVFGFGEAPSPGPVNSRTPDATSISLVVGARYGVSENLDLELDLPWTTTSYAATENALDESSNALGNVMLRLGYDITSAGYSIPLRFGVGIPIAQGEADPTSSDRAKLAQTQTQLVADATRGWREGEYYAVGRMPVSLGGGFESRGERYMFSAMETLLLLPKIKGDVGTPSAIPGGTTSINSFAMRSVTELGFDYWVIQQVSAGLRGWLVYDVIDAIEFDAETDVTQPSPLQLVLEPRLQGRLDPLTLSLGYIVPLGGRLSDGSVSGVRLGAEASF